MSMSNQEALDRIRDIIEKFIYLFLASGGQFHFYFIKGKSEVSVVNHLMDYIHYGERFSEGSLGTVEAI